MEVRIHDDTENKRWIVEPIGDLDAFASPDFQEKVLESIQKKNQDLLLNGKHLDYVDSTGLGALIGIYKYLKDEEKEMILVHMNPTVMKLMTITELDKIFTIQEEEI